MGPLGVDVSVSDALMSTDNVTAVVGLPVAVDVVESVVVATALPLGVVVVAVADGVAVSDVGAPDAIGDCDPVLVLVVDGVPFVDAF